MQNRIYFFLIKRNKDNDTKKFKVDAGIPKITHSTFEQLDFFISMFSKFSKVCIFGTAQGSLIYPSWIEVWNKATIAFAAHRARIRDRVVCLYLFKKNRQQRR